VVAPAFREDYGLTALEAMAFGKPVVACTDGGGLAELVEHGVTGFVVEPTGPAVARAITRLCEDRDLGREMGRVARDRAQTYTWDAAVSQVEHALHAAVPA
jgi:glycosyltransferase involved in cell wall biosynthesis